MPDKREDEIYNFLKGMNASLKSIERAIGQSLYETGQANGWTWYKVGKSWFYQQQLTYAGSTTTLSINFERPVQVNRVEQIWNDGTAKDFDLRMYSKANTSYYVQVNTKTANTDTSVLTQLGQEYKFAPGSKMELYYTNYTVGKILFINVQVDEL